MNSQPNLTRIAMGHFKPQQKQPVKMWRVYYGNNKKPWFENQQYGFCQAEVNRLMKSGQGYHKELFKIKP